MEEWWWWWERERERERNERPGWIAVIHRSRCIKYWVGTTSPNMWIANHNNTAMKIKCHALHVLQSYASQVRVWFGAKQVWFCNSAARGSQTYGTMILFFPLFHCFYVFLLNSFRPHNITCEIKTTQII